MRLSKKYGVNPTMATCFWCGKETGEIMLMGANKGKEAPRYTCFNYQPCDSCQAGMATGITFIEVRTTSQDGRPYIQKYPETYPTGNWWVLKREAVTRMVGHDEELYKAIMDTGKSYVTEKDAKELGFYEFDVQPPLRDDR